MHLIHFLPTLNQPETKNASASTNTSTWCASALLQSTVACEQPTWRPCSSQDEYRLRNPISTPFARTSASPESSPTILLRRHTCYIYSTEPSGRIGASNAPALVDAFRKETRMDSYHRSWRTRIAAMGAGGPLRVGPVSTTI